MLAPYLPKLEFSVKGLADGYYLAKVSVIYSESREKHIIIIIIMFDAKLFKIKDRSNYLKLKLLTAL